MDVDFDDLHFSDCYLSAPQFAGDELIVPVRVLFVVRDGATLRDPMIKTGPYAGLMVFRGAVRAEQRISEYLDQPRKGMGFKTPRTLAYGAGPPAQPQYRFDGVQLEPVRAWIDWVVCAQHFEFRDDGS